GGERHLFGNVSLEGDAFPARLPRHCHRFISGAEMIVDREHLGPFLSEAQHGGAAVAHALARGLSCADDDGDFILETHVTLDDAAASLWKFRDGNELYRRHRSSSLGRIARRAANSAGVST